MFRSCTAHEPPQCPLAACCFICAPTTPAFTSARAAPEPPRCRTRPARIACSCFALAPLRSRARATCASCLSSHGPLVLRQHTAPELLATSCSRPCACACSGSSPPSLASAPMLLHLPVPSARAEPLPPALPPERSLLGPPARSPGASLHRGRPPPSPTRAACAPGEPHRAAAVA
jgi:hypothetical protein